MIERKAVLLGERQGSNQIMSARIRFLRRQLASFSRVIPHALLLAMIFAFLLAPNIAFAAVNIDFQDVPFNTTAEAINIPGVTFSGGTPGQWLVIDMGVDPYLDPTILTGHALVTPFSDTDPISTLTVDFVPLQGSVRFGWVNIASDTLMVELFNGGVSVFTHSYTGTLNQGYFDNTGLSIYEGTVNITSVTFDRMVLDYGQVASNRGLLDNLITTDAPGAGPTISIEDANATPEGDSGTTQVTFNVTLSEISASTVTVQWATADDSATAADNDYETASGTVTFIPGDTSETISVTVNGDTKLENNETFFVNLTNAANASIFDDQAAGTITNDDTEPTISIGDMSTAENNTGTTTNVNFTVTLSAVSGLTTTVQWATADNTATAADDDYETAGGTVTFDPGDLSKSVPVQVNGDAKFEANEQFFVNLTNATNATMEDNQAVGAITNDDAMPTISIGDATVTEGDSGTTDATFTITLSSASGLTASVDWATGDDSATAADNDYETAGDTVTFMPGDVSKTVTVEVNGDAKVEENETFFVDLADPTNATIADGHGVGTINNDDTALITIEPESMLEGNIGISNLSFTIKLSTISDFTITADWTTADDSATAADNDYETAGDTVTFQPGETSKIINVPVNGDTKFEADEQFFINLTNATNATISDPQVKGTITNDDAAPTISIGNATVTEGDSGTTDATFTISLSPASGVTATVDWATGDDSATTADGDYDVNGGTVTFAPGEITKTVPVTVHGDVTTEANERFFVNLTNPTNATLGDAQGDGTITNDDHAPVFTSALPPNGSVGTSYNHTFTAIGTPAPTFTLIGTLPAGLVWNGVNRISGVPLVGGTSETITVTATNGFMPEATQTFTITIVSFFNAVPSLNYFLTATPTLTWNRITGATEYRVEVYDNSALSGTPVFVYTGSANETVVNPLTPLTDGVYYWRVRTETPTGAWSPKQQFTLNG
jgi:Calx-beta domain-containing protein